MKTKITHKFNIGERVWTIWFPANEWKTKDLTEVLSISFNEKKRIRCHFSHGSWENEVNCFNELSDAKIECVRRNIIIEELKAEGRAKKQEANNYVESFDPQNHTHVMF